MAVIYCSTLVVIFVGFNNQNISTIIASIIIKSIANFFFFDGSLDRSVIECFSFRAGEIKHYTQFQLEPMGNPCNASTSQVLQPNILSSCSSPWFKDEGPELGPSSIYSEFHNSVFENEFSKPDNPLLTRLKPPKPANYGRASRISPKR